jgi:hypothetical protein
MARLSASAITSSVFFSSRERPRLPVFQSKIVSRCARVHCPARICLPAFCGLRRLRESTTDAESMCSSHSSVPRATPCEAFSRSHASFLEVAGHSLNPEIHLRRAPYELRVQLPQLLPKHLAGIAHSELAPEAAICLIIPCSSAPTLSNNIIQKGLAFGRDWSGSVVNSGR